jgi:hypothetical protein
LFERLHYKIFVAKSNYEADNRSVEGMMSVCIAVSFALAAKSIMK